MLPCMQDGGVVTVAEGSHDSCKTSLLTVSSGNVIVFNSLGNHGNYWMNAITL